MKTDDPGTRRRRRGALAAICGGLAACLSSLSVVSHNVIAQGICIAAALALIVAATVVLFTAVRRR